VRFVRGVRTCTTGSSSHADHRLQSQTIAQPFVSLADQGLSTYLGRFHPCALRRTAVPVGDRPLAHRLSAVIPFAIALRSSPEMDAASSRSFDGTTPIGWGASSHPEQPFRSSEPNPAAWGRLFAPNTVGHFAIPGHDRRANTTSATWTSSSGDWADLSDTDHLEVCDAFVQEYNLLARKHGIRTLAPDHDSPSLAGDPSHARTKPMF
jgi:hypothetical protein